MEDKDELNGLRENDPELYDCYTEELLVPGWAGELRLEEARYISEQLVSSEELRRAWGFRKRKRYPLSLIAERACPENPKVAKEHIRNQMKLERKASLRAKVPFPAS
jgi:hypothetical protein